jgi:hypothetical protein
MPYLIVNSLGWGIDRENLPPRQGKGGKNPPGEKRVEIYRHDFSISNYFNPVRNDNYIDRRSWG